MYIVLLNIQISEENTISWQNTWYGKGQIPRNQFKPMKDKHFTARKKNAYGHSTNEPCIHTKRS